jgi:hypothetical protein
MHVIFEEVAAILNKTFPNSFSCTPSKYGQADVLVVKCASRAGSATVFSPDHNGGLLLSLKETEEDDNRSEGWYTKTSDEIVQRIQPWAFPSPRTEPSPIDKEEQKTHLELLAKGLAARLHSIKCVVHKPSPAAVNQLTEESQEALYHDIESLSTERIVQHFPWDSAGRLSLEATVLLSTFKSLREPGKGRTVCLAAIGPERRREEQTIRVELANLIVVNQSHRWESYPWLWNDAETPANGAETTRAAQSLRLLDKGKIEEALAVFGVTMSDDLHRLLGGERIPPPACCARPNSTAQRT